MKKIRLWGLLSLLTCLSVAVLMGGCRKVTLQEEIDRVNAQCPLDLGMAGTINKVWLDGNTVVFVSQLNPDLMNVEKLKKNPEVMKEASLLAVVDGNQSLSKLIAEKVNLKYTLTDTVSQASLDLLITNEELAKAVEEKKSDEKKFIQRRVNNQLAVTNLQLPMDVDAVTKLVDFSREGDYAVYTYDVDSKGVSLDVLKEALPNIKENASRMFAGGDPSVAAMGDLLVKAGMGLIYRYRLGKTVEEFSFTHSELKKILNEKMSFY